MKFKSSNLIIIYFVISQNIVKKKIIIFLYVPLIKISKIVRKKVNLTETISGESITFLKIFKLTNAFDKNDRGLKNQSILTDTVFIKSQRFDVNYIIFILNRLSL